MDLFCVQFDFTIYQYERVNTMIKLIAFDLYGTLITIKTDESLNSLWKTLASFMGYFGAIYNPDELKKRYHELESIEKQSLKIKYSNDLGEINVRHIYTQLYKEKQVNLDINQIEITAKVFRAASTQSMCRLYNGVENMLQTLKNNGIKIALISNAQYLYTQPELKQTGIDKLFDKIFISSDYQVKKPSPLFFEKLIEWASAINIEKSEIMMVGNSPYDDINPARNIGLKTCFIHSELTEDFDKEPKADVILDNPNMKELCERVLEYIKLSK